MHYNLYILYSSKCDLYYIGFSKNPEKRLVERYNIGSVKATHRCRRYELLKKKLFETPLDATREGHRIKMMKK